MHLSAYFSLNIDILPLTPTGPNGWKPQKVFYLPLLEEVGVCVGRGEGEEVGRATVTPAKQVKEGASGRGSMQNLFTSIVYC